MTTRSNARCQTPRVRHGDGYDSRDAEHEVSDTGGLRLAEVLSLQYAAGVGDLACLAAHHDSSATHHVRPVGDGERHVDGLFDEQHGRAVLPGELARSEEHTSELQSPCNLVF